MGICCIVGVMIKVLEFGGFLRIFKMRKKFDFFFFEGFYFFFVGLVLVDGSIGFDFFKIINVF